jgi:TPR repeat protein
VQTMNNRNVTASHAAKHRESPMTLARAARALLLLTVAACPWSARAEYWDADRIAAMTGVSNVALKGEDGTNKGVVSIPTAKAFDSVTGRIANTSGIRVHALIFDDDEPNARAFNVDGKNYIGVSTGMLSFVGANESDLAVIVGHEYAHHALNHRSKREVRSGFAVLFGVLAGAAIAYLEARATGTVSPEDVRMVAGAAHGLGSVTSLAFSREEENEADELGLEWAAKAGFNPRAAPQFWTRISELQGRTSNSMWDTHPLPVERAARLQALAVRLAEQYPQRNIDLLAALRKWSAAGGASSTTDPAEALKIDASTTFREGMTAFARGDTKKALEAWKHGADDGEAPSQHNLAAMLEMGAGVDQDLAAAAALYEKAARQHYAPAMTSLGLCYHLGRGVAVNSARAFELYREAAELGDTRGKALLGYAYFRGMGTSKNLFAAEKWVKEAAQDGNPLAQHFAGMAYVRGFIVAVDPKEAARWFRLALAQGFAPSETQLGLLYLLGSGVPKDLPQAYEHIRRSAAAGEPFAQFLLGRFSLNGIVGKKSESEAVDLFRASAEQGFGLAQAEYALMLLAGRGVPQDVVSAAAWFAVAEETGKNTVPKLPYYSSLKANIGSAAERYNSEIIATKTTQIRAQTAAKGASVFLDDQ